MSITNGFGYNSVRLEPAEEIPSDGRSWTTEGQASVRAGVVALTDMGVAYTHDLEIPTKSTYKLVFDVVALGSASLSIRFGNRRNVVASIHPSKGTGHYEFVLAATPAPETRLFFVIGMGGNCVLENISLKRQ